MEANPRFPTRRGVSVRVRGPVAGHGSGDGRVGNENASSHGAGNARGNPSHGALGNTASGRNIAPCTRSVSGIQRGIAGAGFRFGASLEPGERRAGAEMSTSVGMGMDMDMGRGARARGRAWAIHRGYGRGRDRGHGHETIRHQDENEDIFPPHPRTSSAPAPDVSARFAPEPNHHRGNGRGSSADPVQISRDTTDIRRARDGFSSVPGRAYSVRGRGRAGSERARPSVRPFAGVGSSGLGDMRGRGAFGRRGPFD